jgi:beta-galactosidase/beta-glucuronidase
MQAKRIFLHIRGARLRAEVFLNQQLVGYSIMEELPFECDLTHAAKPGEENHLAIRLTNPFGRFDWVDGANAKWGHLSLYRSHGFGGLDRGMTLSAHDSLRIRDIAVLNTLAPGKISVRINAEDTTPRKMQSFGGTATCELLDNLSDKILATQSLGKLCAGL